MKNQPIKSLFAAAALLSFGISSAAFADDPLKARASTNGGEIDEQTGSVGPLQASDAFSLDGGSANSHTSADYGVLKLYAEALGSGETAYGTSIAYWTDTFLFESDTLDGQAGKATVHFRIDGSISATTTGNGNLSYGRIILNVGTPEAENQYLSETYQLYANGSTSGSADFLNTDIPLEINFIYGTSFDLGIYLNVVAWAGNNGAHVVSDFSHTSTWEGITDIEDAFGNPVTDYSFSSTSGVNYINAVPEPSTTVLFIGAGAFVIALARRRFRKA